MATLEKAEARSSSTAHRSLAAFHPTLSIFSCAALSHSSHTLSCPNTAAEQICAADTQRCKTRSKTCHRLLLRPVNMLPINARVSDFSQTFRSDRDREDTLPGDGVRQRRWGWRYLMNVADALGWKGCSDQLETCKNRHKRLLPLVQNDFAQLIHWNKNCILHVYSWSHKYKTEAQVFMSYDMCFNTSRKSLQRRSNTLPVA